MNLDPLTEALRLLENSRITEFELEDGQSGQFLRLRRSPSAPPRPAPRPAQETVSSRQEPPSPVPLSLEARWVGRFYFAPDAPQPGERVEEDQILGGVESMRLMNAVASTAAGQVIAVHVEEGQPVEYGQILFEILPDQP